MREEKRSRPLSTLNTLTNNSYGFEIEHENFETFDFKILPKQARFGIQVFEWNPIINSSTVSMVLLTIFGCVVRSVFYE